MAAQNKFLKLVGESHQRQDLTCPHMNHCSGVEFSGRKRSCGTPLLYFGPTSDCSEQVSGLDRSSVTNTLCAGLTQAIPDCEDVDRCTEHFDVEVCLRNCAA